MARVSRKGAATQAGKNSRTANLLERIYKAAAYVRLSVEDNRRGHDDESIVMQQYMLEKYIEEQPDMKLQGVYCDNGETGTDFARPGFAHMMDQVYDGKIDCIVVKDLSRFGRNYIETGYYLEQIFPCLGVRFVAINDNYDTGNDCCDTQMDSCGIRNDSYGMQKDSCDTQKDGYDTGNDCCDTQMDGCGIRKDSYGTQKDSCDIRNDSCDTQNDSRDTREEIRDVHRKGHDTRNDGNEMVVCIKNLVNDLYARDISRKTSTALFTKQKNGEYIGAVPPYGYLKSPEDKHKLVIDPETASVVRNIFQWRTDGAGIAQIVRKLNEEGIPAPSFYYYQKGFVRKEPSETGKLWKVPGVRRMLGNPVYAGHMAQGKTKKYLSEGLPKRNVPCDEWIIVKNTHPPIVDQETFDKVQELLEERRHQSLAVRGKYETSENIFKGLVVCADCGRKMVRRKNVSTGGTVRYAFVCSIYEQNRGRQGCTKKYVREQEIQEAVLRFLRLQADMALDTDRALPLQQKQDRSRGQEEELRKKTEEGPRKGLGGGEGQRKKTGEELEKRQRKELGEEQGKDQRNEKGEEQGEGQRKEPRKVPEGGNSSVQKKIKHNMALRSTLYESFCDGALTKREYQLLKAECDRKVWEQKEKLEELQKTSQDSEAKWNFGKERLLARKGYDGKMEGSQEEMLEGSQEKIQEIKPLTRKMALELIRWIRISGYNELEIMWNFQDEFVRRSEI